MTKRIFSRALSLLIAAALLCGLLGTSALARETDFFDAWPDTVDFSTLTYGPADGSEFYGLLEELEAAATEERNNLRIVTLLYQLNEVWTRMYTEYTVCMVAYYRDPSTATEDYVAWSQLMTEAQNAYIEMERTLLESQYGPDVAHAWGSDVETLLAQLTPDSPEQLALLSRDQELVTQYWRVVSASYTVTYGGREWTQADLDADRSLSGKDARAVQDLLHQALNAAAAPILVEMVEVRNQYARSKGYDNYAQYAYEAVYGRDYTLTDARTLYGQVKESIAPMLGTLYLPLTYNQALNVQLLDPYTSDLSQEEMLDLVAPYMERISSEYAALYEYMCQGNLADIGPLDTKLEVGFTTGLPAYSSAVMFNSPYGSYYDIETLTHEFGHYAEYCLSDAEGNGSECIDVAEMDSQMLELLFLEFADEMFQEGGDAYRAAVLYQVINSVVAGCYYDEFQTALYTDGDMTVEEINTLAGELAGEYGISNLFGGDPAYTWVQVNHTFESPMYYMSYATSALSALELFLGAQQDFDAAVDAYLALVARGTGMGYREAVSRAGLTDYFQPGTVTSLAEGLQDYLNREVYDLPAFSDLQGHWAAGAAWCCASVGLFQGDTAGNFLPDQEMSRAQLVTVLWRLMGAPEEDWDIDGYSDVAEGDWYAPGIYWATQVGIASGVSAPGTGEASRFNPEGEITREQLAVMLYRLMEEKEVAPTGVLTGFRDGGEVSSWAQAAMDWAVSCGLLTGKPGDLLDPQGSVTRAEAAAILQRLLV